ncbi:30S ribosomal protein S1, chloroplastic [Senna tora]|uniref:30S ribosomal protein S1, chloroplastic n=1 Tax=Senna tora TaxID=362788 RepID=A0A834W3J8_9FABA|nr:30S ribosomal protein S1, chloroplastic [Senna tora]
MTAMPMFTATLGSFSAISFFSQLSSSSSSSSPDASSLISTSTPFPFPNQFNLSKHAHKLTVPRKPRYHSAKVSVSGNTEIEENPGSETGEDPSSSQDAARLARRSADWKAAKAYKDSGFIFDGRIEGFNGGGLLIRFYSLVGFLPFPQLSPLHSCKEPLKSIHDTAKDLVGSLISVKVIQADEDQRRLIFSEKEAAWSRFSDKVKVGDIFEAIVGSVEDYGAFVHLRFPDGLYHLTGLVHISEVSWDLVHDVRDILTEGDKVKVKVIGVDREKSRLKLSIKQLEEDPLLETLDKVIPQSGSEVLDDLSDGSINGIEPLPGLETILQELLQEDGIDDARINRQGFEKRVVSQDLQLWLSNAPPTEQRFTLLARAGRQVQEIHLSTSLDQEGIKRALQRVLERVP